MAVPSELLRKLVVILEVLVGTLVAVLQIVVGKAVVFNCNQGLASNEPPPAHLRLPGYRVR